MSAISVLMKPASSLCNMSCRYCFYCDEAQKREHASYGMMSEATLKNIIRKTLPRAEHVASYAYQGGEPTLRGLSFFEQAVAYQKQYNHRGIRVQNAIQTNGYIIDEAWCRFFKENNFLVGLSVDGMQEIHDSFRHNKNGSGTYETITRAAALMDRFQVDYNILTVVTAEVAANIEVIYKDYQKRGWNYQQYIACLEPLGEGHGTVPYALTPESYGNFLVDLFQLWYDDVQRNNAPYIRQFENYVGLAAGYAAEACDQRGICGVQSVVEADGSVYPCDFYMLDEYRLGNFNEDNLDQIDQRRRDLGFIERSQKLDSACQSCRFHQLCRGGCQRHRDYDTSTGLYHNYFCKSYQIFFGACYEHLVRLGHRLSGVSYV